MARIAVAPQDLAVDADQTRRRLMADKRRVGEGSGDGVGHGRAPVHWGDASMGK